MFVNTYHDSPDFCTGQLSMRALLEFPAIRGIQAGREYYVSMCPLGILQKFFVFNEPSLTPEMRVQRQLNRSRVPEMARYLVENPSSYVFSAITASIDGDASFKLTDDSGDRQTGILSVPWKSKIIINDGQHRRAAIEAALEQVPALADETIAVVLFHDRGLARCQQMFADLNRYAVRPARSLNVLYDHRDDKALLVKLVIKQVPLLSDLVEMQKSSLSQRSKALFTLSALYTATAALLMDIEAKGHGERAAIAAAFWNRVCALMPHWELVRSGEISSGALRDEFIHSHGVTLHALGRAGNTLLKTSPGNYAGLKAIKTLDWRRSASAWDGRAVVAGRMSKSHQAVILTGNAIKSWLGLPLSAEERLLEDTLERKANVA